LPTEIQGGIIRVAHNRANPYTMVNRAGAEDARLSWEARGVLFYLLCKPDGWQVRTRDLQRRGSAGRDQLRRILNELETAGYLRRDCLHEPDGRWRHVSTVYEVPGGPEPEKPVPAEPGADDPAPVRAALYESATVPRIESSENPAPVPPESQAFTPPPPAGYPDIRAYQAARGIR
jgi:hypothetical protein